MKELFNLSLAECDLSDERSITIVTALIKATQTGELTWRVSDDGEEIFHQVGLYTVYKAEYEHLTLYLVSVTPRSEELGSENWPLWSHLQWPNVQSKKWRSRVMLLVHDRASKTSSVIPGSGALMDLFSTVKSQASLKTGSAWDEIEQGFSTVTLRHRRNVWRHAVLEAYSHRCAISGENTQEVLEVASIIPSAAGGSIDINNAIVLRADLHRLFDRGLISISPSYRVIVSPKVTSLMYRAYDGQLLHLPEDAKQHPSVDAVIRHNKYLLAET